MSVNPQYTYDNAGNPVGVFLSITDWNKIVEELAIELPEWQKQLMDLRLQEYHDNPASMEDTDAFFAELDREDTK
ncbi:hypothetical protein [Segetibacter sp.]|jgi:hypothetical protein|uniref:hypothetical protein n=1 Tax=Segetibacter sp. TaxID=2231182 RepID=UPI0026345676|nr:hypothetical protein [Segetibacter sp.]MCW3080498.1 hypothetical protein [Segetibacter sp.]